MGSVARRRVLASMMNAGRASESPLSVVTCDACLLVLKLAETLMN